MVDMGNDLGNQHVYPAGLIGQFAMRDSKGSRPREEAVWVARRGSARPFPQAAHNVGFDGRVPRAYAAPAGTSFDFDQILSQSETYLGSLPNLMPRVLRDRRMPAIEYVAQLIPFVAGLLSRSPRLGLADTSSLNPENPRQVDLLNERVEAVCQALYVLTFDSTLMLVRDIEMTLFTNDTGYTVGPGPDGGLEVFLPLGPGVALVAIVGGNPNLNVRRRRVPLRCVDWSPAVLDTRKWLLAFHARSEAYASTREIAADILVRQQTPQARTQEGFALEDTLPPEAFAGILRRRAPDPVECLLSWMAACRAVGESLDWSMRHLDTDSREALMRAIAVTGLPPRRKVPSGRELRGYPGAWRVRQADPEGFEEAYLPNWP